MRHLILPAIVLGTVPMAVIARQTRSAMLEVLSEDYVRTARAKGLPPWRVIGLHALRNALIPVVTVIGLQVGIAVRRRDPDRDHLRLAGRRQVAGRFDRPARLSRRCRAACVLIASIVMLVNLLVDLLYGLINPRIRHAR